MLKFKIRKHLKILVVIGLLIFLHFIKVLSPIERLIVKAGQPLIGKLYQWGSAGRAAYDRKTTKTDSPAQAACLEKQVNQLVIDNARLKELESENQKLRGYLNFFSQRKLNYLLANVISQENFLDAAKYGQNIIIDKGRTGNVLPGLAIVNEEGIIIGKVIESTDNSARVCLLTNATCKLAVSILNQNRTIGVTEGDLGLTVKINFVSQTEEVNVGDIVVTSGLEKDIPAGLVLGRVSQINNNQNDVWQNINVEPLVNFDNLGVVSAVLP